MVSTLSPSLGQAAPWADPGDSVLRHDLHLLADSGLLEIPITAWPLSWGDIARGLSTRGTHEHGRHVREAFERVQRRIRRESRDGRLRGHLRLAGSRDDPPLRTFDDALPREEGEAELGVEWMGKRFAWRIQATEVSQPSDNKDTRWDGSYAGTVLGNWMLSASAFDRWWGPGWEGSLILSSNARPVPALAVQRRNSDPPETSWLRWIGPWQFTFFAGQLEEEREIPKAKLLGARFNFKPTSKLEIGLSRTAQWGGDGRPETFDSFLDLLRGKDNSSDQQQREEEEAGNQLGGYDFRWTSPLFDLPYAVYAQYIGEDEAGNLPSKYFGQVGLETWGALGAGSYRLHLEYADTKASDKWSYAYNHPGIYVDGYRYYGRVLGHPMDNDSRMLSLGALWVNRSGTSWGITVRRARLNRDDAGLNTVSARAARLSSVELMNRFTFAKQQLAWGAALQRTETEATGETEEDGHLYAQWRLDF